MTAAAARPRGNKARITAEKATSGRATPAGTKPRATKAKRPFVPSAKDPGVMKLGIPATGATFYVYPDWSARVSWKCRQALGRSPEQVLAGMQDPKAVSADTVVEVIFLAMLQANLPVDFEELLDQYDTKVLREVTLESVSLQDVDSPEA